MYRPAFNIGSKARYGGIGERPPDLHRLINRMAGNEEQRKQAQFTHIEALLREQLRREEDGIKEYNYLIEEVSKAFPQIPEARELYSKSEQLKRILVSILEAKKNHVGLLRRLIVGLLMA